MVFELTAVKIKEALKKGSFTNKGVIKAIDTSFKNTGKLVYLCARKPMKSAKDFDNTSEWVYPESLESYRLELRSVANSKMKYKVTTKSYDNISDNPKIILHKEIFPIDTTLDEVILGTMDFDSFAVGGGKQAIINPTFDATTAGASIKTVLDKIPLMNESSEKIQLRQAIELLKDAKRSIFYINSMRSSKKNPTLDELENATTKNIDKFLAGFK